MYNGWKNYPTWRFVLELDNDETLYNLWRMEIKKIFETCDKHYTRVKAFKKYLHCIVDDFRPTNNIYNGYYADILDYGLEKIDFFEVAESFVVDYEHETRPF